MNISSTKIKVGSLCLLALTLRPQIAAPQVQDQQQYVTYRCFVRLRIAEYPNDVGVHFARGVVARLDSEYERALRSFDRMVRLNPNERVVTSYNRARIFMYQQRYEEALQELDQGAEMEPDHPVMKTIRARVLYYRGEVDAATRILEQVLARHPKMDDSPGSGNLFERPGQTRAGQPAVDR